MRIQKYVHSCILISEGDKKLLFDPGKFTFQDKLVAPETFKDVDFIILTHDHLDHIDIDALTLISKLSGADIYGNSEVTEALSAQGLKVHLFEEGQKILGSFKVDALVTPHQEILSEKCPKNTAYLINDKILNPGDSFSNKLLRFKGIHCLILPVMAPFLTELDVYHFALKMKPEIIFPVHDGFAKPYFLKQRYNTYLPYFKDEGIQFLTLYEIGDGISF
ncbi:MBL fold metallo-hydrolase [Leeuwenhoekiella polynyae]|uniref:L-ascorbate metabolism protein UlaG (Beta-lactamase superfamily) n=3 Tax=Leeuwenhoekiella TaxID=283735 RepID=A0A4Q0PL02_9FLAO|nr:MULTISPECIES: MBL fold metallo-hydrolase [Leeuwenhoekiella]RXG25734.1 L-ascorbate metabolism protein UlaG (beta-lactamase superfamily) [Leeuwenhoekiella polynyae]RXG27967.1 L-ascorbate metabolism protein UlaG (beta-lactamase superfamily) [Leeuwenhoekiella marinoflava]SHF59842.1 L-ascorbate metabolism protein UlaG, beta-lactamase superfamily [Leeuwenhoekiella marinoflava DSM 3653]